MIARHRVHPAPGVFVLSLTILLLFAMAGQIQAGTSPSQDNAVLGLWAGSIKDGQGLPVRVDLEVKPDEAELLFGAPLSCTANAVQVTRDGDAYIDCIAAKTGGSLQGWCKRLRNGTMDLTKDGAGTLSFHIANPKKNVDQNATLRKNN